MAFSVAFSQALEIVGYVNAKANAEHYDYLGIQKISEMLNIPVPSIKKISGVLKKTGILDSKTGINGGLRLARAPEAISVYDVFVAIEGTAPIFQVHTDINRQAFVNQAKIDRWLQAGTAVLGQAETAMLQVFKKTSIADLDRI
ncbi:RrF2 family transcriptional regulator [Schleiferilactobacillus shenzhenensis]|uniref:Rrf2 family transcriptional regulator n=1 Tax=Schleiferilactobacillus shenzhenensis LY-73 TaxID=1231336 RepID=U4TM43_9LACO|nr:Rrf2 family transcriptional regulator [Schleiferilactobacillus shenzhenensis]ERL65936.1 hypothetical protein L248_2012 [Schleiferilactobacillus shenzhenensis LY-73]